MVLACRVLKWRGGFRVRIGGTHDGHVLSWVGDGRGTGLYVHDG